MFERPLYRVNPKGEKPSIMECESCIEARPAEDLLEFCRDLSSGVSGLSFEA